jgi:hypothetical protein
MTKEVMQQAFDLIERLNKHGWILADFETEVYATLDSLKAALEQPPLPVQPVVWDKPSTNFNDWWDSDLRGNANPFTTDSFAYWAWEGWQAAQRPWVGLTGLEQKALMAMTPRDAVFETEAKLKEKNHG